MTVDKALFLLKMSASNLATLKDVTPTNQKLNVVNATTDISSTRMVSVNSTVRLQTSAVPEELVMALVKNAAKVSILLMEAVKNQTSLDAYKRTKKVIASTVHQVIFILIQAFT